MTFDALDVVLLAASVLFAFSGYRQGFVVGVLSFVGFLGGGILGARFAPTLHSALGWHVNTAVFGIIVVFLFAAIGQAIAVALGSVIRRRITWRPAWVVDSIGGAAVSVASLLLVAWMVGTALADTSLQTLAQQVNGSAILTTIDRLMPNSAKTWDASFRRLLAEGVFPQVFGTLGPEPIRPVAPPDPAVAGSYAVRVAAQDVVKVLGVAPSCSRQLEGSGFVFAAQHVLTNAHVVAGTQTVQVVAPGGGSLPAQVVLYDPRRDVAVLYVPGLSRPALRFAGPAGSGASAVVAGYPENGPFLAVAARVRDVEEASAPDIYQDAVVTRQIYSLRAVVRPGNSGGPLLAPDGAVYGVVFARALDSSDTGYALTAAEVAPDASAGSAATAPVSTETCDAG